MSDIVIRAEGLGKKYLIGHQTERERYTALRDVLARNVRDYWRKAQALARGEPIMPGDEQEEIWALRDVSFEIRQGEAVGIIGRNGAGKSTLLKILSRITEPSAGRVTIKGRVASLLEVGTGFHPELTGRENIFLNGAILGMTRREIKRKFDEIVDFAEVEKFLDTPVKRYSSGMYVRLAFAVAAHLESEILLVDEVLAVGDTAFQKKCLSKMSKISQFGRTILFISHNIEAIDRITNSCIWFHQGSIKEFGSTDLTVKQYLVEVANRFVCLEQARVSSLPKSASVVCCYSSAIDGAKYTSFRQGEKLNIVLDIFTDIKSPIDIAVVIENSKEQPLFTTHLSDNGKPIIGIGEHRLVIKLDKPLLRKGFYLVSIALFSSDYHFFYDIIHHYPLFEISGTLDKNFPDDIRWGDIYLSFNWIVM